MATASEIPLSASGNRLSPVLIAGPTAVGKSEIALLLAERIGGEIISVDSMQVYRGLDIGTAKPSVADRARVRHHLIDVADLSQPFDAAKFIQLANQAVAEIQTRCQVPILCGGTGLYFKAFIDGLGEAPPADKKIRAELETTPLPTLLQELEHRDPVTYLKIDRQNPRRIIRAVEVIRLTGRPFSEQQANWKPEASSQKSKARFFAVTRTASDLHARINARVDGMFACGLVDEVRQLFTLGLEQNKTAMQAIGYRQVVEHLRGERTLPTTIDLVKSKTRQYAKRQLTWLRKHAEANWIELAPTDSINAIVSGLNLS